MLRRGDTLQARLPATKKYSFHQTVCFSTWVRSVTVNGSLFMEIRTMFVYFLAQLAPPLWIRGISVYT